MFLEARCDRCCQQIAKWWAGLGQAALYLLSFYWDAEVHKGLQKQSAKVIVAFDNAPETKHATLSIHARQLKPCLICQRS